MDTQARSMAIITRLKSEGTKLPISQFFLRGLTTFLTSYCWGVWLLISWHLSADCNLSQSPKEPADTSLAFSIWLAPKIKPSHNISLEEAYPHI